MAKISRHGGPSNQHEPRVVELVLPEAADEERESPGTGVVMLEDDAPDGPYAAMLRGDLQAECVKRGLSSSGNKAELIARLTAADEAEMEALHAEAQDQA